MTRFGRALGWRGARLSRLYQGGSELGGGLTVGSTNFEGFGSVGCSGMALCGACREIFIPIEFWGPSHGNLPSIGLTPTRQEAKHLLHLGVSSSRT